MINDLFKVHKLNAIGIERARSIAEAFSELLVKLEAACGTSEGREMAIVRTKLQDACFYAKRAMASRTENQE